MEKTLQIQAPNSSSGFIARFIAMNLVHRRAVGARKQPPSHTKLSFIAVSSHSFIAEFIAVSSQTRRGRVAKFSIRVGSCCQNDFQDGGWGYCGPTAQLQARSCACATDRAPIYIASKAKIGRSVVAHYCTRFLPPTGFSVQELGACRL